MKSIVLFLAVVICIAAPISSQAIEYVGDACWEMAGSLLTFSVIFVGWDSSGHEIINYTGSLAGAPTNGNCIERFIGDGRFYECNVFSTGPGGNAAMFVLLDYYTLVGLANSVFNIGTQSGYVNSTYYQNTVLTPIACPSW